MASTISGRLPNVVPLRIYDVTPYESSLRHINSIMAPNIYTSAPVVGVAITTQTTVAGSAPGANHLEDLEGTARFLLEAAKAVNNNTLSLYDAEMFEDAVKR